MTRRGFEKPSDGYLAALGQYAAEAREYHSERRSLRPNASLLTNGLGQWLHSVAAAEVDPYEVPPRRATISIYLPNKDTMTERHCDPEFLYVAILHVIHGGSFRIQVNESGKKYYWRITIYKGRGARILDNRQPYALRLIVGTRPGYNTNEYHEEFKDVTRATLGRLYKPGGKAGDGKYGRKEAIAWSIASYEERPRWQRYKTSKEYRHLLDEAYGWLDLVPLGQPS